MIVLLVEVNGTASSEELPPYWVSLAGTGEEFPVLADITGVGAGLFADYSGISPTTCIVDPDWSVVACRPLMDIEDALLMVADSAGVVWAP